MSTGQRRPDFDVVQGDRPLLRAEPSGLPPHRSPASLPPGAPARQRSRGGWATGFLMGMLSLAILLVGGWVGLEWFIFPAMDATGGRTLPLPIRSNPVLPDSSLRSGSALSPVPRRDVPEVPSAPPVRPTPLPPASPAPAATPPASQLVAGGETAFVLGSGISLRAGPSGTDPVVANRSRGTSLHIFARQNGWLQLGDSQPIGWGWGGLVSQQPPDPDAATPAAR